MFETAELGRTLDKKDYEKQLPALRTGLLEVQRELAASGSAAIVLVNGVDGAGKGETVNLLLEWLDARHVEAYAFPTPTEEERQRPPFWRYWMALPPRGKIGICFGSWYTEPILDRVLGDGTDAELDVAMRRVRGFERMLVADGALLLKFWFHLSKPDQRRRLEELEERKETRWRVTKRDWDHYRKYEKFRRASERALRETSVAEAPWVVVDGSDSRHRSMTVGRAVLDGIREHLRLRAAAPPKKRKAPAPIADPVTVLDRLDLTKSISGKEYDKKLEKLQGRLNGLSRLAKKQDRGVLLVFEGWDAAGKGGAIRRVASALDARQYRVVSIAAPTDEEKARQYLWRFWRHLPRLGRFTIYDRSWYGRVLVERVEGFASEPEWQRGYPEIVDFEEQLVEFGIVLVKFWLHISEKEQLRRFREREVTPWKQHKITEEDWRNRHQWHNYELAANEMVSRTSTEFAPWHLIEANDKHWARIQVLRTLCERLEEAL